MTELTRADRDETFLAEFEAGLLPPESWTHEAHVRLAWIVLPREPEPAAIVRIRAGIRRYNAFVLDRADAYHDTLTVAFVRIIAARMVSGDDWPAFRAANADILDFRRPITSRYYSDALLNSDEARRVFVEPDLTPLPRSGRPMDLPTRP